jgi:hypothetical protein
MNRKRYEGAREMRCVLNEEPRLEEAIGGFMMDDGARLIGTSALLGVGRSTKGILANSATRKRLRGKDGILTDSATGKRSERKGGILANSAMGRVSVVALPERRAKPEVERAVCLAVMHGLERGTPAEASATGAKLRVRYWSVHSGTAKWRWIAPHAFGHDGYRWHVRAWCFENADYRDFVLGRMEKVGWPEPLSDEDGAMPKDAAWERWVTLIVRPNRSLSEIQQKAVAMDFQMRGGKLKLRVREAMADYVRTHLRVPLSDGAEPGGLFEVAKGPVKDR